MTFGEQMAKDAHKGSPHLGYGSSGETMYLIASKVVVPLVISSTFTLAAASVGEGQNRVCVQIGASISSSSSVYYPGTLFTLHHAMTP